MTYSPLPVPCAGCGELTPYEVSDEEGVGSYGEWLSTPIGRCFVRTCWDRACVLAARERLKGRRVVLRESKNPPARACRSGA